MFPELEIAALVSTPEPEQAEAPLPIRVREKSEWDAGMVLEAWVKNTTGRKQPLSVRLSLASAIEEVWGGTYEVNGSDYIITSDKAIEPGEEWDPTIKISGSDHGYQFKGTNNGQGPAQKETEPLQTELLQSELAAEPAAAPASNPKAGDTPATLVYAPHLDPGKNTKRNILDNFGGVYDGGWGWENIEIVDGPGGPFLRTHMEKGAYVGEKDEMRGAGFDTRTLSATHAVLTYDLRFKPGFDPVKGGKLPGLMAGDSPSGHKKADNGITARMMWRRNSQGELYLYYPDMKKSHGDSIGRGNFHFDTSGEWHQIKQEVKLNHIGQNNGFIKVWYDGELVIEATDLRLRTKDSVLIEGVMHTIFFGGGNDSWAAARDEWVDTRNFRIVTP
ncbi:polysaccharide lyase [Modicisalibacter luteus]|uniref:Polysaccharide lyase n=2 Tax=Modicisalibacter luteus TaxID=453962 RepID=A0ABV7M444_9GAMM